MGLGETEAIIGARVGNSHSGNADSLTGVRQTLRGICREHNFIKFADMPCGGCECVVEGGCMQGCCVGGRIGVRSRWCMERVTVSTKSTRVKEDTGHVVDEGRRLWYGEGGMVRA